MNSHDEKERREKDGKGKTPDAGLHVPNANVGMEGQCIVPPHPEAVRINTGEPCDDGREGGKA